MQKAGFVKGLKPLSHDKNGGERMVEKPYEFKLSNLKTRLVVKCPSCGSVMTKRRKKGKGAGIIYECPNSECPVISVRIRYRHGKRRNPKNVRMVRDASTEL